MATYGYSIQAITEARAHASMQDAPFSYKVGVLIANRIKGMPAEKALRFLRDVQTQKQAVPYTKFNDSVGHRPGSMGPGRYPQKAAKAFEQTLANAVANAEDKGLGKDVWVEFALSQQGHRSWRNRAAGRHKAKRAHIEIVVTNAPNVAAEKRAAKAKRAPATKQPTAAAQPKATKAAPKKEAAPEADETN